MTEHEKAKMMIKPSKRERHETMGWTLPEGATGIDWRTKGVLGPVMDQG